jgi:pimeloyl-ACP methyl ester carboxylesterase
VLRNAEFRCLRVLPPRHAGRSARRGVRNPVPQVADRRWTPEWFAAHPEDAALLTALATDMSAEETQAQTQGRLPTFVGSGRHDDIAPVANGQAIVDRITNATLHVYESSGHLFLLQDPAAWPEIATFLGPEPSAQDLPIAPD